MLLEFGSCNRQNLPQEFWSRLEALHPAAFLWTGDAAYAEGNSVRAQREALEATKRGKHYASFAASTSIYGTWDDHDYGVNDGGRLVDDKDQRRINFLDFLGFSESGREGVYYAKDFTTDDGEVSVKVIFLDTRTHRDMHYIRSVGEIHFPFTALASALVRLLSAAAGVSTEHGGDVLGTEQWAWLEAELTAARADTNVVVVVSSIQVATTNPVVESWGHFPLAKRRLFDLFKKYDPPGLMFISGDVHHAEISSVNYTRADGSTGQWFEFTSSGLTHTCRDSILTRHICPLMLESFNRHRAGKSNYHMEKNFGLLTIEPCNRSNGSTLPVTRGECRASVNASIFSLDSATRLEQIIVVPKNNGPPVESVDILNFQTYIPMYYGANRKIHIDIGTAFMTLLTFLTILIIKWAVSRGRCKR